MSFTIKNGKGTGGYAAEVDANNDLHTLATIVTENHQINRRDGLSFFTYADITPTGAGSTFLYIQNNSSNKEMVVDWYRLWTAAGAPEGVDVYVGATGTPTGGAALVPVNRNLTSGKAADGTFLESVALGGLTGGVLFDRLRIGGGDDVVDEFRGGIILGQNDVLEFRAVAGAIPLEMTIAFYFEEPYAS
ncbi:MAG: hypothetical protein GQ474_07880 [Sulfurimonas sp.]|nr:hypothetical protein [Sulfurimonas sp.]